MTDFPPADLIKLKRLIHGGSSRSTTDWLRRFPKRRAQWGPCQLIFDFEVPRHGVRQASLANRVLDVREKRRVRVKNLK